MLSDGSELPSDRMLFKENVLSPHSLEVCEDMLEARTYEIFVLSLLSTFDCRLDVVAVLVIQRIVFR